MNKIISGLLLGGMILGLSLWAYSNRFVQDDAYISFRYADNLVHGLGLVWNPGERVEGYTNFLWVVMIAGGLKLGLSAPVTAMAVGLILFPLGLLLLYQIAFKVLEEQYEPALLVVLLTGANYTFNAYATGGLETMLQTVLLLAAIRLMLRCGSAWSLPTATLFSITCALGVMTRPDFALFAAVLGCCLLWQTLRTESLPVGVRGGRCLALLLPGAALLLPWLIWKWEFYGSLVPNTYYAKAAGWNSFDTGAKYLYHFLSSYRLFPVFVLLAAPGVWILFHRRSVLRVLVLLVALWTLYGVKVGGCFMEFRLFVPVIPLIMLFVVWMLYATGLIVRPVRLVLAAAVVVGSLLHMQTYRCTSVGIESIADLQADVRPWILAGKQLQSDVGNRPVSIATKAAGAIAYYSRLVTLDEHGLNDRWVAHHGRVVSRKPGHQLAAPLVYMAERKINLVIGDPMFVSAAQGVTDWHRFAAHMVRSYLAPDSLPVKVEFITIPVRGTDQALAAWYLTPSAEVETIIRERGWVRHTIEM